VTFTDAGGQYKNWITAMAGNAADIATMREIRPGFKPAANWHPLASKPFGDEEVGAAGVIGQNAVEFQHNEWADTYADRLATLPGPERHCERFWPSPKQPEVMPPNIVSDFKTLQIDAGLGTNGLSAAPGHDRETFESQAEYQDLQKTPIGLSHRRANQARSYPDLLRVVSFWKMKTGVAELAKRASINWLLRLLRGAPGRDVRFIDGPQLRLHRGVWRRSPARKTVNAQSSGFQSACCRALSLWSYALKIPYRRSNRSYPMIGYERLGKGPGPVRNSEHTTKAKVPLQQAD